jgi:hypothetical protein
MGRGRSPGLVDATSNVAERVMRILVRFARTGIASRTEQADAGTAVKLLVLSWICAAPGMGLETRAASGTGRNQPSP